MFLISAQGTPEIWKFLECFTIFKKQSAFLKQVTTHIICLDVRNIRLNQNSAFTIDRSYTYDVQI